MNIVSYLSKVAAEKNEGDSPVGKKEESKTLSFGGAYSLLKRMALKQVETIYNKEEEENDDSNGVNQNKKLVKKTFF